MDFNDDSVNEPHETVIVNLEAISNAPYTLGTQKTFTLTIQDDDPPAAPSGLSLTVGSQKLSASLDETRGPGDGLPAAPQGGDGGGPGRLDAGRPVDGLGDEHGVDHDHLGGDHRLTNGTAYHVQVRATDGQTESGNGYGAWSASQSGTPAVPTLAAPTGLSVTAGDTPALPHLDRARVGHGDGLRRALHLGRTRPRSRTRPRASGNDPSAAWGGRVAHRARRPRTRSRRSPTAPPTGCGYARRTAKPSSAWVFGTGTPEVNILDDADLSSLTAQTSTSSGGTLTALNIGTFAKATTTYTASVANTVTHLKLTPTLSDSGASVKVGKQGTTLVTVASGTASGEIALAVGANAITVEVTAENGTTTKTYTVTVTRAQSNVATLSALSVTGSDSAGGTYAAQTLSAGVRRVHRPLHGERREGHQPREAERDGDPFRGHDGRC